MSRVFAIAKQNRINVKIRAKNDSIYLRHGGTHQREGYHLFHIHPTKRPPKKIVVTNEFGFYKKKKNK